MFWDRHAGHILLLLDFCCVNDHSYMILYALWELHLALETTNHLSFCALNVYLCVRWVKIIEIEGLASSLGHVIVVNKVN